MGPIPSHEAPPRPSSAPIIKTCAALVFLMFTIPYIFPMQLYPFFLTTNHHPQPPKSGCGRLPSENDLNATSIAPMHLVAFKTWTCEKPAFTETFSKYPEHCSSVGSTEPAVRALKWDAANSDHAVCVYKSRNCTANSTEDLVKIVGSACAPFEIRSYRLVKGASSDCPMQSLALREKLG